MTAFFPILGWIGGIDPTIPLFILFFNHKALMPMKYKERVYQTMGEVATMSTAITTAITDIMSTVSTVVTTIQGNALFMIFAASGVLAIGIRVVKKLIGRY